MRAEPSSKPSSSLSELHPARAALLLCLGLSFAGTASALQGSGGSAPSIAGPSGVQRGFQASGGPCTGGTLETLTVEACLPDDCQGFRTFDWFGQALRVPKFDPSLGSLVGIRVDLEADWRASLCYENLGSECCLMSYALAALFVVEPGANDPPLGAPAPWETELSMQSPYILLGPSDGHPDCALGPQGPPADGTCTGGDHGQEHLSHSLQGDVGVITDPAELAKWVAGQGQPEIELLSHGMGFLNKSHCSSFSFQFVQEARVRLLVSYDYCSASPGVAFCSGDGSGGHCPCLNPGQAGAGCANSSGFGAQLLAQGSAVVADDDLVLEAAGLVPAQPAILFMGRQALGGGAGQPFGDGLLCVGGALVRLGVRIPDAQGHASWGPGLASHGGWHPGDVRRFQVCYRDPDPFGCAGFNLSNGLEVAFH